MSKQDRQGARTPADIERRYNVKRVEGAANSSLSAASSAKIAADGASANASSAQNTASAALIFANEAKTEANKKVDKTDDAQIITMINRAEEIIHLIGKRLKIEAENFTLTETGKVTMSDATIKSSRVVGTDGAEVDVSTEIKEGTIVLEPGYTYSPDYASISFELLRFKYLTQTYGLYMIVNRTATTTGHLLTLDSFHISEIVE
mgnify:CR=1 FL=1